MFVTLAEGSEVCPNCGVAVAASPKMSGEAVPKVTSEIMPTKDLSGLRGWLVLARAVLVWSAFMSGVMASSLYSTMSDFSGSSPVGHLFHLEITTSLLRFVGLVFLNILFSRRKRIFPKCMIVFLCAQFGLDLIDYFAAASVAQSIAGARMTFQLMADLEVALFPAYGFWLWCSPVLAFAWVAYLLRSRRVKATFVR